MQTIAKQKNVGWRHSGGSHSGGSHGVFIRADGRTLPVPARRPIKPICIANARLALKETIAALRKAGHPVPASTAGKQASGKFVARVPKSVHAKLSSRAKGEGVSLNTLVVSLLAEGLGKKSAHA